MHCKPLLVASVNGTCIEGGLAKINQMKEFVRHALCCFQLLDAIGGTILHLNQEPNSSISVSPEQVKYYDLVISTVLS